MANAKPTRTADLPRDTLQCTFPVLQVSTGELGGEICQKRDRAKCRAMRPCFESINADTQTNRGDMSTRSKRTLSAAAVIAALSAPSAAHARFNLNPTSPGATGPALHVHAADVSACPRGVACVSVDTMLTQGITNGEAAALGYNVGATHGLTYGEKEAAALGFGGTIAQTTGSSAGASGRRRHARGSTEASSSQPFEWGDAGIGAGGMFLLLSAGAATAVVGQRRRHRTTTG